MAIENNLPVIFDTATQNEDGLMSYQDKIKLDNMSQALADKVDKFDKIPSSMLDSSSEETKIQPEHLSKAVKDMITGNSPVSTTAVIDNNSVTIDKIDKRTILANVLSPRPLNFAFDSANGKVTINIPQGTLLLPDGTTKRNLVTGSDTSNVTKNIGYPEGDWDGLNYLISKPSGDLSIINHRKANTISNTNSIVALISLNTDYSVSMVMNGNYTINGLAQGVGTDSAALMGTGKIVFDSSLGAINFAEMPVMYLMIGGVFSRTIEGQNTITLADYSEDNIYILYWDNASSSLKTTRATINNIDTDINKIALIKDGRTTPRVNTGIFYSKPYANATYYSESFDYIDNISLVSESAINITRKTECKIEFKDETYVCLNEKEMLVSNKECPYDDRIGVHFILFDLDNNEISCRHHKEPVDTTKKNIVIGTLWVGYEYVIASGGFQYTVDGKAPYEDDLADIQANVAEVQKVLYNDLSSNKLLTAESIYMIEGEELPIYESSLLINDAEGLKTAVSYNKNGDVMSPRIEFFDGQYFVDSTNGDKLSVFAYDKYNSHSYITEEISIKKVPANYKEGNNIKVLCLGDNLITDSVSYVRTKLINLGVDVEMVGTTINGDVYAEGRDGWFYSTFVGASGRGLNEGNTNSNPFIRIANADDKAKNPTSCYRATGAYIEKNYSNDSNTNGQFFIFDFANYMEVQGVTTPDVVVIAIKPELAEVYTENIVSVNMQYLRQMVNGIRRALPDAHIALVPQYGYNAIDDMWEITSGMITETNDYVADLADDKIKVLPSWLHMNREFNTDTSKIELANSITAFIMNI